MNNDNHRAMVEWQAVPKIANGLVVDTIRTQLGCDTSAAHAFWSKLLFWATEYPAVVTSTEQPGSADELIRLRELAAACYAGLVAECNLPEKWADVFLSASTGEPFSTEGLLPFTTHSSVQGEERKPMIRFRHGDPFTGKLNTPPPAPAAEQGEAVELTKCCGREECGGECGNEWRGTEWVRKAQPEARGVEGMVLDARIWKRESTQEWVLELSGSANDTAFICRHTEPLTTPLENVAGLPSLYAATAAPGFDDIAVHCQQAGCQFLNPLPEPVRVDEAMAERLRIAFYPLLENIKRCHIKDALTAALAPNGGKEKL